MSRLRTTLLVAAFSIALPAALLAQGTAKTTTKKPTETQAQMEKEAKIKTADAKTAALKEVPGGTVSKEQLERKKGKLVYAFTIKQTGKPGSEKVDIDAMTGDVASHTHKAARAGAAKKPTAG